MLQYEAKTDCFDRIRHVKTELKWGDLKCIPEPWITVVVPTYKRQDTLKEALESILNQQHCDFLWDVVVLDNEPDDGKENGTEQLIREINNKRILYYRNSENIRPGDNFNRGFETARGKWVMFLHDDDLLINSSIRKMGQLIETFDAVHKNKLGAISAQYIQFFYNEKTKKSDIDLPYYDALITNQPNSFRLYKLTHRNVWFTANIGGDIPSNGTTYNRDAIIQSGGINEEFGISGDLISFYRMENHYKVYSTMVPMGFYRWGNNSMSKISNTIRVVKDGKDFRQYVYHKSPIRCLMGKALKRTHDYMFLQQVVDAKNKGVEEEKKIKKIDIDEDCYSLPNGMWYAIFVIFIQGLYLKHKMSQANRIEKKARKIAEKMYKKKLEITQEVKYQ